MPRAKKSKWPKIKKILGKYENDELLNLFEDLYNLSEETKVFLEARLFQDETSLQTYKTIVHDSLIADPLEGEDLEWDEANKAIKQYKFAVGDDNGLAELLVLYVETANQFTLTFGDIDEVYYETVEGKFQKAIDHLISMSKKQKGIQKYVNRLRKVVQSTEMIGWGYHDNLCDMFSEAFGEI